MIRHHSARDFDWVLLGITMAITILGLVEIYSATRNTPWQEAHLKQIMWIGLGLAFLWIFSAIDYNILIHHAPAFYAIAVALLLLILVLGQVIGGARRWLPMPGGTTLQVSEFVKVVLVLLMARLFSGLHPETVSVKNLLKIAGLFAAPMFLVARQPDLSTALSYAPILFMGVFIAGLRWKYVLVLALAGALILPLAWQVSGTLSEGAADHLPGSGAGSEGFRISADPVGRLLSARAAFGAPVSRRARKRSSGSCRPRIPISFFRLMPRRQVSSVSPWP